MIKKMKRKEETYEMPCMEVIDILPESVLCGSGDTIGSSEGNMDGSSNDL